MVTSIEKNDGRINLSLLQDSELLDSSWNYINIWKQEAFDDPYLMSYFLETPPYFELCKTNKYIVSWRKGTWKTALRRAFKDSYKDNTSVIIDDIEFQKLFTATFFNSIQDKFLDNSKEITKSYVDKLWWILLVRWILLVLKNDSYINESTLKQTQLPESDKIILESILKLNGYIDLWDISNKSVDLKTISLSEEILKKVSFKWIELSHKTSSEKENTSLDIDFEQVKPYIENYLLHLIKNSWKKFFMLIDGFDKARTFCDDIVYKKIITDFLISTFSFNEKLSDILGNGSRVIIFIRNDILDLIEWEYDDMAKLRWDYRINIDWQKDYLQDNSLLNEVINKRIDWWLKIRQKWAVRHYEKPYYKNALVSNRILSRYFDEPPKHLQGFDGKFDLKRFLHNRTLLRPRDYIQFFWILSRSKTLESFEKDYSEYLKSQTLDEIKKIVPDFQRLTDSLEKSCRWKTWLFKGEDFTKNYISDNTEKEKLSREAKIVLKLLYEYSVIWYMNYDINWHSQARFFYRESDTTIFDPNNCILHSWLYRAYWVMPKSDNT